MSITLPFHIFAANCSSGSFFGLPSWHQYLQLDPTTCEPKVNFVKDIGGGVHQLDLSSVLLVGLGVLDILMRIAGLVAVGYVMYGGIRYVTSQGEPDKTKQAQGTVLNALIGLAITVIAAAVVSFIGNRLGGS